jgi:2-polyprenyl-3-methyl-5-hydroxy-6-metoxy-1,4-benzoquinol methylase
VTFEEAFNNIANIAKEKLGDKVKIVNTLFEKVKLPTKYDNIVLTHVLEHLDDPVASV